MYSDHTYAFHFLGKNNNKKNPNPKQHYYNIFISFKHIPYNKHNEAQGISIVSSKRKGITSMFLKATPVIQKKRYIAFELAQYFSLGL